MNARRSSLRSCPHDFPSVTISPEGRSPQDAALFFAWEAANSSCPERGTIAAMDWHPTPKDDAWRQTHLAILEGLGKDAWLRCDACSHSVMIPPRQLAERHGLTCARRGSRSRAGCVARAAEPGGTVAARSLTTRARAKARHRLFHIGISPDGAGG
jgi:hypothetical protein